MIYYTNAYSHYKKKKKRKRIKPIESRKVLESAEILKTVNSTLKWTLEPAPNF